MKTPTGGIRNIKPLQPSTTSGEPLHPDIDRSQIEGAIRAKLAEYGIEASNFFIDWDLKTVVVLCSHITSRMRLFMSRDAVSLGGVVRDSLVSAHRIRIGGEKFGLVVMYCKKCFGSGVKMLLGEV